MNARPALPPLGTRAFCDTVVGEPFPTSATEENDRTGVRRIVPKKSPTGGRLTKGLQATVGRQDLLGSSALRPHYYLFFISEMECTDDDGGDDSSPFCRKKVFHNLMNPQLSFPHRTPCERNMKKRIESLLTNTA